MLLHLQKPKPYILMDVSSYAAFGIRPGRMYASHSKDYLTNLLMTHGLTYPLPAPFRPDLFLAKLKEKPRKCFFEVSE